jgi:HlyD family secretion protein
LRPPFAGLCLVARRGRVHPIQNFIPLLLMRGLAMRRVVLAFSLLGLAIFPVQATAQDSVTVPNCIITAKDEVEVPAQEPGVLLHIPVREGDTVAIGDTLAQIDDVIPRSKYDVAVAKLKAAATQAANEIEVKYAEAGYAEAAAKLQRAEDANQLQKGAFSKDEIGERRLEAKKFFLSIDKAKKDLDVAQSQKEVAQAELQAAKADMEHRQLKAPQSGVVVDLRSHQGEWVQAGDPVMRLLRLDLLQIDGGLTYKQYLPQDIEGRPVEVTVTLAGGQHETFPGKIVFVSPQNQQGGYFHVRAEVKNRKLGNSWLLRPGMDGDMTIQLK